MNLLAQLLPGVRDLRTPLAVGVLWVAFLLVISPLLPSEAQSKVFGAFATQGEVVGAIPTAVQASLLGLVIYILGVLLSFACQSLVRTISVFLDYRTWLLIMFLVVAIFLPLLYILVGALAVILVLGIVVIAKKRSREPVFKLTEPIGEVVFAFFEQAAPTLAEAIESIAAGRSSERRERNYFLQEDSSRRVAKSPFMRRTLLQGVNTDTLLSAIRFLNLDFDANRLVADVRRQDEDEASADRKRRGIGVSDANSEALLQIVQLIRTLPSAPDEGEHDRTPRVAKEDLKDGDQAQEKPSAIAFSGQQERQEIMNELARIWLAISAATPAGGGHQSQGGVPVVSAELQSEPATHRGADHEIPVLAMQGPGPQSATGQPFSLDTELIKSWRDLANRADADTLKALHPVLQSLLLDTLSEDAEAARRFAWHFSKLDLPSSEIDQRIAEIRVRLKVDQSALYDEYDRLRSEGEFRSAIAIPLAAIIAALGQNLSQSFPGLLENPFNELLSQWAPPLSGWVWVASAVGLAVLVLTVSAGRAKYTEAARLLYASIRQQVMQSEDADLFQDSNVILRRPSVFTPAVPLR